MTNKIRKFFILVVIFCLIVPTAVSAQPRAEADAVVNFSILHTNDFHGQLEASGSNPGMARTAEVIQGVRTAVGAANVLLVDAGDEMQGSLLSNLQKGAPVIATYNAMGYDVATFGNHEFDWGQTVIGDLKAQAAFPYVSANIVVNDTGTCGATTGWTAPAFAQPYVVKTVAGVKVAFIGVTTKETPIITTAVSTAGLCFKDPADSVVHYYDAAKAESDIVVVLSHLGYADGGYGYGISEVYGDQSLATKLINAGKAVPLIIGGHSHTDLAAATVVTVTGKAGKTTVVQAHYNGRKVGRADLAFDKATGNVTVTWQKLTVSPTGPKNAAIDTLIQGYANDAAYQAKINEPVGYTQVDLKRDYNGDNMMGNFVDDAIYNALNTDTEPANDVDMFFNNAGGIRTDWCDKADPANPGTFIWSSDVADCANSGIWTHSPMLLNYGKMFTILPFGNATVVGTMTGAQIIDLLHTSATLGKGALQPAGMRYTFYRYSDGLPGPQPYAWGAYDACVIDKVSKECVPIDPLATYKVGTNEFLAPAGGDNFSAFKYMKAITYWGDMLNAVNAWVTANFTQTNPYKGPNGDGTLDVRITRDGTDTGGSIVPVTILHSNDAHGRLVKSGTYQGMSQLATLITQERAHNPSRTLLVALGDNVQGDSMMYYFKSAGLGFAADGKLLDPKLRTNPMIAVMNTLKYDAMVLGNHEFNFGNQVFTGTFRQANFPLLGANFTDSGAYGINKQGILGPFSPLGADGTVNVYDGEVISLGDPAKPIKVGLLGLTNHRVPSYELPSNIPGLTFTDPLAKAAELAPVLRGLSDAVVALTHIGFTGDPKSVEVDTNVDTRLASQVNGLDAIIGSHSHTNPTTGFGDYKYLPAYVSSPDGHAVLINQAYRYNTFLGEVVLGMRPKTGGGYDVISTTGRDIAVDIATPEDATVLGIVAPYQTVITAYNNTQIGQTTAPIDTLSAHTQETNGANMQADASVAELISHGIIPDFHLSGAMTNARIAETATGTTPYKLKISDMFSAMPYENSLVVINMNGPQLKAVLERAYRNYYYYKYVTGYGGYSYYTTCMLDTNSGGEIVYNDQSPTLPDGNNVVSLKFQKDGAPVTVDFADADTYYKVSTVNYLAAGACNFSDGGVSLWPLAQIANDTQYYVRDAVIDYVKAQGTVSPKIEARLMFQGYHNPALEGINAKSGWANNPVTYIVRLVNNGTQADTFNVSVTGNVWPTVPAATSIGPVDPGAAVEVIVTVTAPANTKAGSKDIGTVKFTSQGDTAKATSIALTTTTVTGTYYFPLVGR